MNDSESEDIVLLYENSYNVVVCGNQSTFFNYGPFHINSPINKFDFDL